MTITQPLLAPDPTWRALSRVCAERLRQDQLKAEGRFEFTLADEGMSTSVALAALGEEFGEVCTEVQEIAAGGTQEALRDELAQVAAVALAWIEKLDRHIKP